MKKENIKQLRDFNLNKAKSKGEPVYPKTVMEAVEGINSITEDIADIKLDINDINADITALTQGKVNTIQEVTWQELKNLRDNSQLVPGALYRITDYNCTTTQENTQSAGHQFDIIVTAISNGTLSEEAEAICHDNDTYFSNSNLSAWKVWYCLDNDTARFSWADDRNYLIATDDIDNIKYYRNASEDIVESGLYAWVGFFDDSDLYIYTKVETPNIGDKLYDDVGDEAGSIKLVSNDGRGVIYRLIDEFNNDVCYDFKNIMYKRTVNSYNLPDPQAQDEEYLYTFTDIDNDDNLAIKDASITAVQKVNDEGARGACVDNLIQRGSSYISHVHVPNNSDLPFICIAKGTLNNDSSIQYSSVEIVGSYGITLPVTAAANLHIYNSESVATNPEEFTYLKDIFILGSSTILLTFGDTGNFIVGNKKASLVNR